VSWFKPTSRNDASIAVLLGDAPDEATPAEAASPAEAVPTPRPAAPHATGVGAADGAGSQPYMPPAAVPKSVLGRTLRFKGDLHADEDFVLQGHIEGAIHHSQHLGIGVEGVVKGDSRARSIVVEGTVHGDLYALEFISLRSTALVTGNLFAPRVSIADGATFNGRIDMATAAKAARAVLDRHEAAKEKSEPSAVVAQPPAEPVAASS
jgi:cytoskeletal protein CcmA (bactofilin family)